jgi:rRNA biogenesis protein RRP5
MNLQISDNPKADVDQALLGFQEGDPVRAIILAVNLEKERISFGLKPSYFADDDFKMHDAEASSHDEDERAVVEEGENAEASESEDDDAEARLMLWVRLTLLTELGLGGSGE